ncbi:Mrp/NBP35 family ATP-binding protein [Rubinisphaera margarita]|uniref:Mrp/NBP35 family ATP-binding protein n=1 Tax=Rubinisphaera margarita TaxID=2909586 RepID=UPI001EE93AB0|nr:Mrp/NBP35 family ATP-binding protein [Rubinisphaera margarita]MCG6156663.1 Mrp/NBP35 family ATP-binding protein [Rubinisphaera margarita]
MSSQIPDSLKSVVFPGLDRTLDAVKAIRSCTIENGTARVELVLPFPGAGLQEKLTEVVTEHLKKGDVQNVEVSCELDVKGPQSGGTVGLRAKNVIAVGSGKGGVGKSTVSASLAYGLRSLGATVGLLDADVYGPSIPHLTGATGKPEVREHLNQDGSVVQRIHPVEHDGLKVMSIGFLVPEEEAVIWRGPMLHKLLTQFVSETHWGDLDYLIVDMPPGTGDVALTLSQMMSLAGAVVVCTPQKVALLDAVKAIGMYQKVNIPILGMVENMSGEIFGRGGAEETAREKGIPFLGEIPTDANIRIRCDESRIKSLFTEESATRERLEAVASAVALQAAKQFFVKPPKTTLDILQ